MWLALACSPASSTSIPDLVLLDRWTDGDARAVRVDGDGPWIGHEMARARPGDVLIENSLVRFYVTGNGEAHGYSPYAGWIIDAALASDPGLPAYDGLDGFYPLVNVAPIAADHVTIESDGSDGGRAVVAVSGPLVVLPEMLSVAGARPRAFDADVRLEYSLGPDDGALTIRTRVVNTSGAAVSVDIGDVVLFGDDEAEPFTVPAGFDRWSPLTSVEVIGSSHDTRPVSYAVYAPPDGLALFEESSVGSQVGGDGSLFGYTITSALLEPGQALEAERLLSVARDAARALGTRWEHLNGASSTLRGTVSVGGRSLSGARVTLFADPELQTWVSQAVSDEYGQFELSAPPGQYHALATGRTTGAWIEAPGIVRQLAEGYTPSGVREVTLDAERGAFVELALGPPARLRLEVRDSGGAPTPAKIIFQAEDERPEINAACGERALNHEIGVRQTVWTPDGDAELELEAGVYTVVASHGPNAELDVRQGVVLPAGEMTTLSLWLHEPIQHVGYVAIDPHVHGVYSQHGEATRIERVVTAMAEGLDVHVATDHDDIADYSPALRELGLESQLLTVSGVEFKTSNGDHCAWPLRFEANEPLGGARRWWKDGRDLEGAYRYYADRGAIVTHVAHGTSHFRNAGYDPLTGTATESDQFSFGFNAMEVHNGGRSGGRGALVPIWMSLINSGRRVAPLGASDSHGRRDEVGVARTYVRVGPGVPSAESVARATAELHTVASTGPFIELTTASGSGPGDTEHLRPGDALELVITVWAPSWMPLQEVRLWANGAELQAWDASTEPAVVLDPTRAIWFEHRVRVQPTEDQWYAVDTTGSTQLAPVYPGSRPWALTAPLFVDADSDGELHFR